MNNMDNKCLRNEEKADSSSYPPRSSSDEMGFVSPVKEKPAHSTRRTGKNKELSRGGHRPILLRGRTSDVLDIHHPVRNTCVHGRRHGRARRRDSVSEIQYPCHGILHVQPLYLYMVPQISSAGPPALHTGCLRCSGCVRCNPFHRP